MRVTTPLGFGTLIATNDNGMLVYVPTLHEEYPNVHAQATQYFNPSDVRIIFGFSEN